MTDATIEPQVLSETETKGPKMAEPKSASKNSKDIYGASGKTNVLMFDPEKLKIVTDTKSALYDKRHELALDEQMVLNVIAHGILEPVLIRKNPENGDVEVIAGRQRVKWAREANKRLDKQGLTKLEVPAIVKRGQDDLLLSILVSENEGRTADTPITRAEKMQKLLDMGKDEEQLATIFCCSKGTVKNTLALLECSSAVKKAIDGGKINVSTAYALSKLDASEQKTKIEEITSATGNETKPRKKSKKIREIVHGKKPKVEKETRTHKECIVLKKIIEKSKTIEDSDRVTALAMADWFLGKETINKFMAHTIVADD